MKDSELGRIYSHGEVIFKEGDTGEGMYVIQSGKVKITKKTDSADNGSIMLLDDEGRSLTIEAAFGSEMEPKLTLSMGEGIAGDVLRHATMLHMS